MLDRNNISASARPARHGRHRFAVFDRLFGVVCMLASLAGVVFGSCDEVSLSRWQTALLIVGVVAASMVGARLLLGDQTETE